MKIFLKLSTAGTVVRQGHVTYCFWKKNWQEEEEEEEEVEGRKYNKTNEMILKALEQIFLLTQKYLKEWLLWM